MNIPVEIKPEPFGRREEVAFHDRKPVLERERKRERRRKRTYVHTYVFSRLSREAAERSKRRGETVVSPCGPVTCVSGHSFSLIACTRPSGPHVRNNGQRARGCVYVPTVAWRLTLTTFHHASICRSLPAVIN